MKVQIQSLHFDADQKLIQFINKKLGKLEGLYDKIIDSDVILSLDNLNTQIKDKVVVIKTNLPGTTLIAREKAKVFEESVDLAIESIRRQLERYKSKIKN
jgi:putative sigma-54 modulation protein